MDDLFFLRQAIQLAQQAGQNGNLPIGALIILDDQVIAKGMNTIWQPAIALTRHAEMEALCSLPAQLRADCSQMTLFTTLEPCMMCASAILLHKIGRVVFGSFDPYGGVRSCLQSLPPFFQEVYTQTQWIGPALPEECNPLYEWIKQMMGL